MNNTENQKQESKPSAGKENPVEQGKEIIETQKKLSGKPPEEAEKENKEDAQKWRNEG